MKIQDIRKIAKKMGLEVGRAKKPELIRSIQRAEHNNECFGTPYVHDCNQMHCLWREDCLQSA